MSHILAVHCAGLCLGRPDALVDFRTVPGLLGLLELALGRLELLLDLELLLVLVRVYFVEHALGFLVVLRARGAVSRLAGPPRVDGAAYHVAAGVLELVRELLHALVELFHILLVSVVGHPRLKFLYSRGCGCLEKASRRREYGVARLGVSQADTRDGWPGAGYSAAFPASRVATAALLFTGLATRAAASWAQRVIRGEVDPSRVMDRSVSAAATESDKKSGNTGLKEP